MSDLPMWRFKIFTALGSDIGEYDGETPRAALDAYARIHGPRFNVGAEWWLRSTDPKTHTGVICLGQKGGAA